MRIIAGEFRGRALTPMGKGDAGAHLRPTTDRTRESLFNMLEGGRFGDPVDGATVLDLFAGTGALGFESLSRGATHATLVDDGRTAQNLIRANVKLLGVADRTTTIKRDARRLPPNAGAAATLVFLDPPYGKGMGSAALLNARIAGWIAPSALIVWEENTAQPAPDGFTLLDSRKYGDTTVTLMEAD